MSEAPAVRVFLGDPAVVDPLANAAVDEILDQGARSLDFETVRYGESSIEQVGSALRQVGMFATRRCIWLRGFDEGRRRSAEDPEEDPEESEDATADSAGDLLALLVEGIPEGTVLLLSAATLDARGRLFKWLAKNAAIVDRRVEVERSGNRGGRLGEQGVREAVAERLRDLGVAKVEPGAIDEVVRRSGNALGETLQELDRVVLALGDDGVLRARDVRESMRDLAVGWVFDLTRAVESRDLGAAEALIERLLAQGEAPIRLAALLASHVGGLVAARPWVDRLPRGALQMRGPEFLKGPGAQLPDFLRGWPGYFRLKAAASLRMDELVRLQQEVLALDLALKSSPVSPLLLFSRLLQKACLPGAVG